MDGEKDKNGGPCSVCQVGENDIFEEAKTKAELTF